MFAKKLNSCMFLLKKAFYWLKYKILSNSLHGTHSPFVYKFLEDVVYNRHEYKHFSGIEQLRESYKRSPEKITMRDFGAGADKNNNKVLKISYIASNFLKRKKYAQLLYRTIQYLKPNTVIELGTSLGITSSYLALANEQTRVISMEGCDNTINFAKRGFQKLGITNIEIINGNLDQTFPMLIDQLEKIDFIFFDGNHRKQATLDYFYKALEKINPDSVFVFDDIYWSEGMMQAWEEIKNNPKVKVTIDLFEIGIVFFRNEQVKENFIINY